MIRCSYCGGEVTATSDAPLIVMPTMTVRLEDMRVQEVHDNAWCGRCLREWDERIGLAP